MKKLVAIIAVSALLITGNISFALGTQPTNKPVKNAQSEQASNDNKAKQAAVKDILKEIFKDRQEIIDKKADIHQALIKAKKHVKELLQNKDDLTPEQILSLKNKLQIIKEKRLSINNIVGDVAKEIHTLRLAKKNGNIDEINDTLKDINDLQIARMADLDDIITVINEIAEFEL
jgi:plasmid maintenance system antidote protein VapI